MAFNKLFKVEEDDEFCFGKSSRGLSPSVIVSLSSRWVGLIGYQLGRCCSIALCHLSPKFEYLFGLVLQYLSVFRDS